MAIRGVYKATALSFAGANNLLDSSSNYVSVDWTFESSLAREPPMLTRAACVTSPNCSIQVRDFRATVCDKRNRML